MCEDGAHEPVAPPDLPRKARRGRRPDAAPADARRFRRPGGGARQSQGLHRGGQGPRRGARPCAVRRAARPRQDDAGADHGARARRQFPLDLRPGHRQGRRSRRAADQSRRARRAVHRRDPPAQPGGRGNPLSGDGGFPARPDHRRGAGGALGQDRPGQVHAGRRHHAARPADQSVARPFRHSGAAQFLHGRGTGTDRAARRAHPAACRSATTARWRSRGARAARRASPAGCCAACAISPRVAGAGHRRPQDRRRGADAARGRRARPRPARPALSRR